MRIDQHDVAHLSDRDLERFAASMHGVVDQLGAPAGRHLIGLLADATTAVLDERRELVTALGDAINHITAPVGDAEAEG